MQFFSFLFDTRTYEFIPTSPSPFFYASTVLRIQYLNNLNMKWCYTENPWTTSMHLLLFPPQKNHLFYEKEKVILSDWNRTFRSIAYLPILYKSTVLLFFCVHCCHWAGKEDGYLCNVYLGLLLLSCVHQWCLFLMRLLSPSFASFSSLLFSFLCYIFRLYLLILGWHCEFIIILLQRTGWVCMYRVFHSLLSIMVIDLKKEE